MNFSGDKNLNRENSRSVKDKTLFTSKSIILESGKRYTKRYMEVLYPSKQKRSPATSYIYVPTDIAIKN
jgi:hypothetical protein